MSGSVPGAALVIKGNPSLDRIHVVGIGIQNPFDPTSASKGGKPSVDAEVWVDELRVSGFKNRNGWAAKGRIHIKMADLASVNINIKKQTDGFGSLNSRLGERGAADQFSYFINSTIHLNKLIPGRQGWRLPIGISLHHSSTTPRFLPNAGDVTLTDFKRSVYARNDLTEGQKEALIRERINQSQSIVNDFSLNIVNAGKSFSHNAFGKYILDNTTLNFIYNKGKMHNPRYDFQNNWNYSGGLKYEFQFKRTRLFRPFNFLGDIPILKVLAGLKLGYNPESIYASTGIDRNYKEIQRRPLKINGAESFPLQQTHAFTYNTKIGLTYNLTPSIRVSFQNRSIFDLSQAGIRNAGNDSPFSITPTFTVLKNLLTGKANARRNMYSELYSLQWRPHLQKINALRWISYSASYSGGFQWKNSPLGSNLGATITNNLLLNQTLSLDVGDLLEDASWFQELQQHPEVTRPLVKRIGRGLLKSILSVQSINASFNISTRSLQTGYAGSAPFFEQFGSVGGQFSPPFSYRTGITEQIGFNRLINNPDLHRSIQLPSNRNLNDRTSLVIHFSPFNNLKIDLSWNAQWSKSKIRNTTILPDQSISSIYNQTGHVISSVWAFGSGYGDFFKNQLQIAANDLTNGSNTLSDSTGNQDGLSVLGDYALQQSFRKAYLSGLTGTIGKRGFAPFPLPGWRIIWSGLEEAFPFLNRFVKHISLLDSYIGSYRLAYDFNAEPELLSPISLGNFMIQNRQSKYEPITINIEKRFSPLLGINITWLSGLHTRLRYNVGVMTSLALSNATVIEQHSSGLQLTLNYSLHHFKIPLFPRINNAVDLTLNVSYYKDIEKKYMLSSDLDDALQSGIRFGNLANADYSSSFTSGQYRINTSAIIGYHFSQAVTANFEYVFKRLIPKSTGVFPRTEHDIKFNIVVAIQSD